MPPAKGEPFSDDEDSMDSAGDPSVMLATTHRLLSPGAAQAVRDRAKRIMGIKQDLARCVYVYDLPKNTDMPEADVKAALLSKLTGATTVQLERDGLEAGMFALFRRVDIKDKQFMLEQAGEGFGKMKSGESEEGEEDRPAGSPRCFVRQMQEKQAYHKTLEEVWNGLRLTGEAEARRQGLEKQRRALDAWFRLPEQTPKAATSIGVWPIIEDGDDDDTHHRRVQNFQEFEEMFPLIGVAQFPTAAAASQWTGSYVDVGETSVRVCRAVGHFNFFSKDLFHQDKHNPLDLAEAHLVAKALAFVWLYRDEMMSEHVAQISREEWQEGWRYVLAKHLNARHEHDWVTAFASVFPAKFSSGGVEKSGNDTLMCAPPEDMENLKWAGVMTSAKRLRYNGFHKLKAREAEKILCEVFNVLDFSGDGAIDRGELSQFFKILDVNDLTPPMIDVSEEVADECTDPLEKTKRIAWFKKEQTHLFSRTDQMKHVLGFEQQRVCSLNMSDLQLEQLVHELLTKNTHIKLALSERAEVPDATLAHALRDRSVLAQLVGSFILRGEFDKVEWSLDDSVLAEFKIPDRELVDAAGYIVRQDDYERLKAKFAEVEMAGDKQKAHDLIFGTMVTEDEFKTAYLAATGIDLRKKKFAYIWDNMAAKFGGMIPKQTFFHFCGTEPMELMPTGVGGSYYLDFAAHMRNRISVEQHLYLYIVFLISFVCVACVDKGLAEGYYQVKVIEDFIGQELNPGGIWYAQTFYDISNADEFYDNFMPNVLEFAYGSGDGARGVLHSIEASNKVIGGVKLQQWRVAPGGCGTRMEELYDNNNPDACYSKADIGRSTDFDFRGKTWVAKTQAQMDARAATNPQASVSCVNFKSDFSTSTRTCAIRALASPAPLQSSARTYNTSVPGLSDRTQVPSFVDCVDSNTCYYKWIPRVYTPYLADDYGEGSDVSLVLNKDPPLCNPEGKDDFAAPQRFNRSIRVGVMKWDSGRLQAEVLKWLVEEYLQVRVEIIETNPDKGISALSAGDGSIDIILEVWDQNQESRIQSALASGNAVSAGKMGAQATMDMYVNQEGMRMCPDCFSWNVLRSKTVAQLFSCYNSTKCNQECVLCGTGCNCASADSITASQPNAGIYDGASTSWQTDGSTCPARASLCNASRGAFWDQLPSGGITTYGPELHRSRILRLNEHWDMQFTDTEEDLETKVVNARGVLGQPPEPLVFFFYTPSALPTFVNATRVTGFPANNAADCPRPNSGSGNVWGGWNTNFSCSLPRQGLLKLVSTRLRDEDPDVFKFVTSMVFTNSDLDLMLQKRKRQVMPYDQIACEWLKDNREQWLAWLRFTAQGNTDERREQFYERCYQHWDTAVGVDDGSFNQNAMFLSPGNTTGRSGRKVLTNSLGEESMVPSREDWDAMEARASANASVVDASNWNFYRPWIKQSCDELGASTLSKRDYIPGRVMSQNGLARLTYGCEGYGTILPISNTQTASAKIIADLKRNSWIDVATRAVMVEFFTHNQMTKLIVRSRYIVEISSAGGWRVSNQHTVFSLWQWEARNLSGWIILMIVNIGLIVYFTIYSLRRVIRTWKELANTRRGLDASAGHNSWLPVWPPICANKIIAMGLHLLAEPGETLDLCGFGLMYAAWAMRIVIMIIGLTNNNILCTEQYPDDFTLVADLAVLADIITSVNAIAVFLRTLLFLNVYRTMHRLLATVSRALSEIAGLMLAFVVLMLGFALAGWVVYGYYFEPYNGWLQSFQALLFVCLGEFDFESLDRIRPGYSVFFFFFFFIIIIAVLFNVIIAVIGGAYDSVSEQLFSDEQVKAFIEQVMHDPRTCAWAPTRALGLRAWLADGCVIRELGYWWTLIVRRTWLRMKKCCTKDKASVSRLDADLDRTRLAMMKNPRIFWKEYHNVLKGLGSDDFTVAMSAYATVKQLCASAHVRQDMEVCVSNTGIPIEVGDVVYVRDREEGDPDPDWFKGIVKEIRGKTALVKVRCSDQDMVDESGERVVERFWKYPYDFDEIVHDADAMNPEDELVVICDLETPFGTVRKGSRCRLQHRPSPPIVGTPAWQCPWMDQGDQLMATAIITCGPGEDGKPLQEDEYKREQGGQADVAPFGHMTPTSGLRSGFTAEHAAARRKSIAAAAAADPLVGKAVAVDRCCVRPANWEPSTKRVVEVDGMLVKMKNVSDFLDEQLGSRRRPALEFFLVQLPAKVLGMNQVRAFLDLLDHHYQWKYAVKDFAEINEEGYNIEERVEHIAEHVAGIETTLEEKVENLRMMVGESLSKQTELEKKMDAMLGRFGAPPPNAAPPAFPVPTPAPTPTPASASLGDAQV
eukprot:TRINITY_DN125_c6_g1_i1.p1 TRINITY_DN125_c6_g1~~TRINITY_DN125_c6_g1_i1.p1  ORF type:complete len:2316 (+),score=851.57 TRINITY_DN125_c6_g1_i1:86-7033(+)